MLSPKIGWSGLIGLFVIHFVLCSTLTTNAQGVGPDAAQITWTGATSTQWSLGGNWSGGVAPTGTDTALFTGTFTNQPNLTANASVGAFYMHNLGQNVSATDDVDPLGAPFIMTINGAVIGGASYGILIDNTNGSFTTTINTALQLGATQNWTNNSGNLFTINGTVNLNNSTLTIDGTADTTITSVISSGGGSLTKNGTGTLTLSGGTANNYGGTTTVNGGTLVLAKTSGNAITGALVIGDGVGTDTVQLNGPNQINNKAVTINSSGVLDLNANSDAIGTLTMTGGSVITETGTFTLGGDVTTNAFTASATISGNFNLGANRTFTVADGAAADDLVVSANINSSGANLTKAGAGRMVLSGSNLLHDVAVSAGTLTLRNSNALGTGATPTVSSGATLELDGGISINNALTLNGTGTSGQGALVNVSGNNTYSGAINLQSSSTIGSTSGTLTISGNINGGGGRSLDFVGAGNTTVTGVISNTNNGVIMDGTGVLSLFGVNTYNGGTTINSGTVAANNTQSLGQTGVAATINAGTLEITSSFTASRNFTLGSSTSTVQVDPGQTFNVITTISGTGTLNKTGSGTLVLGIPDTYTGGTNISQGTVQITTNNAIPGVGTVTVSGGTLDTQTSSDTVGPVVLKSGSIIGSGTLTSNTSYTVESGSISAPLAGNVPMTKNTSGTVTLSGANTFTGNTTVNAGTLTLASSSGSALGSTSAITVNSGGTLLLGASNQINNSAGMTLNGGTFAKGDFSEGTTSAVGIGALTLTSAGSHLDFGTGTVGALSFASFGPAGTTLAIDNWTGTPNTVGSSSTDRLIFDADQSANLNFFSFTGYTGATEINLGGGFWEVVPVAVPEPSTWAAGALALAGVVYVVLKKRQPRLALFRSRPPARSRIFLRPLAANDAGRRLSFSCAVLACVSWSAIAQASPRNEIVRAVAVHGVSDPSMADARHFEMAFLSVCLRAELDDLPNYVTAAINLRKDLAPTIGKTAVKVIRIKEESTSEPRRAFYRDDLQRSRLQACELISPIIKIAVAGNPNAAARIAGAAATVWRAMYQCIIEGAVAAAPQAKKEITEAVMEVAPPDSASMYSPASDDQLVPVVSPEKP
jgi:autotransporter-associated beta strand protein